MTSRLTKPNRPKSVEALHLERQMILLSDGDAWSFKIVYDLTHKRLFKVAFAILTDWHESEDAVQDAYLSIWRKADTYHPDSGTSPMSWLSRIVSNGAIDRLRKRKHVELDADPLLSRALVDSAPDPLIQLETSQQTVMIAKMLERLSVKDAAALHIAFYDDQTYAVVSQQLGLPEGTIKSTIRRTLRRLRPQALRILEGHEPACAALPRNRPASSGHIVPCASVTTYIPRPPKEPV